MSRADFNFAAIALGNCHGSLLDLNASFDDFSALSGGYVLLLRLLRERRPLSLGSGSLCFLIRLHTFLMRLELLHLSLFFSRTSFELLLERDGVERCWHSHLLHSRGNALFRLLNFLTTRRSLLMHLFKTFQSVLYAHIATFLLPLLFQLSSLERRKLFLGIFA